MSETNEAQLVQRAKAGDGDAFAEIYDRCYAPIYRHILYRVSTPETAEDLACEVFLRMVESIDDFTYRGRPLLAWLYTIARNLISDHHRSQGRAQMVPLDDGLQASSRDPEAAAGLSLSQERLAEAMQQITEDQRQVIVLKFIEGLDNNTVAQIVGKSYGAVKALQHRGLAALRRALE